jgi:hypothetical protein
MGVKATDFGLDETTRQKLFDNGHSAAVDFLRTWDFEKYKQTFRQG